MTGNPDPAAGPTHPVAFDPHIPRTWACDPSAGNPFVACSGPTPVTARPGVRRPGGNCLCFDPNGRRGLSYNNLARDRPRTRARRRNLLRSSRRCHCRWFLSTTDEEKWGQRKCINTFSHINLLAMNSFCTALSALLELVITIFLYAQSIAENGF